MGGRLLVTLLPEPARCDVKYRVDVRDAAARDYICIEMSDPLTDCVVVREVFCSYSYRAQFTTTVEHVTENMTAELDRVRMEHGLGVVVLGTD